MPIIRTALVATCLLLNAVTAQAAQVLDYIVAVVNDEVVLNSELDQALTRIKQQMAGRGELPPDDVLRRQLLERIVVTRIQVQRALQGGLNVSDAELNQAMSDIAARNGLSLNQFALTLRRQGIDYLQIRQQVRDEMLVNRLRQAQVESRIVVTGEDIDLALEQSDAQDQSEYRLAHILIALPSGASPDERAAAEQKSADIVSRARAGEDFSQLAITHSDSPRALEGGDLGWRRGNALPTLFTDVVQDMDTGQVSEPIIGGGGLHIVKLVDKRGAIADANVRETHARHILLTPNVLRDRAQTREELERLRQRIVEGADFAALARKHSEDPGSANQGGDLGWQPSGSFAPEFQRALDTLEIGELSPVFESPFGWHIAEVLERRDRDRSTEIQRAQAREAIFKRKANEEYEAWIRQLRDEAYVEYRDIPGAD